MVLEYSVFATPRAFSLFPALAFVREVSARVWTRVVAVCVGLMSPLDAMTALVDAPSVGEGF